MRVAACLLGLTLASPAAAQTVEDEIRAAVGRYVRAVNRGNPDALAALYLDDPRTSSLGDGRIYQGFKAIADLLRTVYAEMGAIAMTVDSVSVLPLGPVAAAAVMRYRWVVGRASAQPVTGAMTLVFARTRDGWRVAHDHTSTLAASAPVVAPLSPLTDTGPRHAVRPTSACTVARIVDGDTIECRGAGQIRLIGIDTPELDQAPFGVQAAAALAALIPRGSGVRLERDVEARDQYGRLLAYVWLGDILVNWRMVREGWAVLLTYPPNVQYVEWFTAAERHAREEGRGLWATRGFACRPSDRRRGRCE
jgi:micrococcal nuclease